MSYTTSANFGSPRGSVKSLKSLFPLRCHGRRHINFQIRLNLDPFMMIHETFLYLTETAFGSHPCRVVSATYHTLRPFHGDCFAEDLGHETGDDTSDSVDLNLASTDVPVFVPGADTLEQCLIVLDVSVPGRQVPWND
jgi:hypothetical protein